MQVKKKRGPTADPTFGPRAGEGDPAEKTVKTGWGAGVGAGESGGSEAKTSWQNFGFRKPKEPAT